MLEAENHSYLETIGDVKKQLESALEWQGKYNTLGEELASYKQKFRCVAVWDCVNLAM